MASSRSGLVALLRLECRASVMRIAARAAASVSRPRGLNYLHTPQVFQARRVSQDRLVGRVFELLQYVTAPTTASVPASFERLRKAELVGGPSPVIALMSDKPIAGV
jgi:hypothetical protein